MALIMRGAEVAEALGRRITTKVAALEDSGVTPTLATVRVGERGDDLAYERSATRRAEGLGVRVVNVVLPENTSQDELHRSLEELNVDADIHGVLLFKPLPVHLDGKAAAEVLATEKDIDGIGIRSAAGLYTDENLGFAPCTATACLEILDHYGITLAGRHAVVVGRSPVIGKPVSWMLLKRNATVTICHSYTQDLASLVRAADIIIACVGQPRLIDASFLRAGQTVIDVGINVGEDGSLVGDVDFEAASKKVAAITPVPGGVGAVTTSVLVENVVDSALKSHMLHE